MERHVDQKQVGILIPAYQPTNVLGNLLAEVLNLLKARELQAKIIVVDDGSTLRESQAMLERVAARSEVTVVHHSSNLGKGAALKTGIKRFKKLAFDAVVTADADGQHTPKDIVEVVFQMANGNPFVLDTR